MDAGIIHDLAALDASCVAVAGGKGASLGELLRAGAPVPAGFVVAGAAFRRFLAAADPDGAIDAVMRELDGGRITVDQAAARIAARLADAAAPDDVATAVRTAVAALGAPSVSVRSSATCEDSGSSAWAGQLATYLGVAPDEVVDRLRACWLSIFSPGALAYGAAHGYGAGRFAVAVVVQRMVASEVSGIGFSVHPVTQEPGVLLIEACFGLGEAIVSGQVVPDQYVVERATGAIAQRALGAQHKGLFLAGGRAEWRALDARDAAAKLSDAQIGEYAALLGRIDAHYGHPVDTEWALADGQFQVLQARPITTLAEEYREALIDDAEEWQLLVRRPMSLVEVSIWAHWLDSPHAATTLGIRGDRALSIQDEAGLANEFMSKRALEAGLQHTVDLDRNDRPSLLAQLRRGEALYAEAEQRLARGAASFRDLDEAAEFFIEVAQHTTAYPAWVLLAIDGAHIDDAEVRAAAERLRSRSLYPAIERRIIDPLVADATRALGFSAPEHAPHVTTWSELRRAALDRHTLEERLAAVRAGRRFVFQATDAGEHVRFVSQSGYLVMRLTGQRATTPIADPDALSGQAAWPGVHRGRARVVLAPDAEGQHIEDGEVLVSIQSSPALMPLLRRCGAIVTDDGGVACHAAIICRELRKPTLIGTGSATTLIHTGDLVEVDTYAGTVRVLERASR
jgi:phosphohistidine swiveling domain-containing protein